MAHKSTVKRQFYTLPELAERWGVSHRTLILWSRHDIIPSWRPPRARITLVPAAFAESVTADVMAQWSEKWGDAGPAGPGAPPGEGENED